MRTKTLLLTVAIGAVSAATSMAQVYSVNAVGYINVTVKPGFNLIADQLITADRSLAALIPAPPQYTVFYKFIPGTGYQIITYDPDLSPLGWDPDPTVTLDLGGGAFLLNPTASNFTITFVGEVAQGALSNPVVNGFSILSSKVPQAGPISTALQFAPIQYDTLYKFVNPTGYEISVYDPDLGTPTGWDPTEPIIDVGESFFLSSPGGHPWNRTFNVN